MHWPMETGKRNSRHEGCLNSASDVHLVLHEVLPPIVSSRDIIRKALMVLALTPIFVTGWLISTVCGTIPASCIFGRAAGIPSARTSTNIANRFQKSVFKPYQFAPFSFAPQCLWRICISQDAPTVFPSFLRITFLDWNFWFVSLSALIRSRDNSMPGNKIKTGRTHFSGHA